MKETVLIISLAAATACTVVSLCIEAYQTGKQKGIKLAGEYMQSRFEEMKAELVKEHEHEAEED